jgi:GT2 family glycosyltransferase
MISVVYCTRESKPEYIQHIKNTSGIKNIEVIEYVNNGEGLTKPYNKFLKESKYDITVFIHDDLILPNDNWGKSLLNHFNNSDYGILGVAGTTRLSETGVWWTNRELMLGCIKHAHEGKSLESRYCYNNNYGILEAVVIDGLFMAIDKTKIKKEFDEDFTGFHFYDIPFCVLNHSEGVKIGVIFDIKLTHKSIGMTNLDWDNERLKFINKYQAYNDNLKLPLEIDGKLLYSDKIIKLKKEPKIGVIIPTKGKLDLLFNCIDSIFNKSSYENLMVYIADTGSTDEEKLQIKTKYLNNIKVKLIEYDFYNFAEINNDVVVNHLTDEELILFCNNDIQLINDAISRMVKVYQTNHNVGTVGCRLHFANGKVQHAGITVIPVKEIFGLTHLGLNSWYDYTDYVKENRYGSTAAFLLINRKLFLDMNGFVKTLECFEDVLLNLSVYLSGRKNFLVGDAVCYHYESQTRNDDPAKLLRLQSDYRNLVHPFILQHKEKLFK